MLALSIIILADRIVNYPQLQPYHKMPLNYCTYTPFVQTVSMLYFVTGSLPRYTKQKDRIAVLDKMSMHSIFIVIGIIVLGIVLCFAYLPRIMTPRRLDSLFHFVLTLLATLAGVFLAFQISNYQVIQNDKEFLAGLLDESASEFGFEIKSLEDDYLSLIDDRPDIIALEQLIKVRRMLRR